jgi:ribonuclease HI
MNAPSPSPKLHIYTDGASSGNPGPGGYGVILLYGQARKELSAGFRRTTNNRMELLAVIAGLEAITRPGMNVEVWSDSRYVVDAVEKGWVFGWEKKGFKDKKNPDLWKRFLRIYRQHKVRFHWIKGHNQHPLNERCDELAVAAARGASVPDSGYESGEGGQ